MRDSREEKKKGDGRIEVNDITWGEYQPKPGLARGPRIIDIFDC